MQKKRFIWFLLLLYASTFIVFAQEYADIQIDIAENGLVTIDGTTNYEPLKNVVNSPDYTSKEKEYWKFNLVTNESFDEYIFRITLPENAQINYVKAPPGFRIENNAGRIAIVGFAENQKINILVQYKIDYLGSIFDKDLAILVLSGFLVVSIILSIVLLMKLNDLKKRKHSKAKHEIPASEPEPQENSISYDIELFTPRQQEIIKLLEVDNKLTQKELEEKMNIPKSSVSRNIKTLEIKGIIIKERVGQTNYIILKK